MSVDVYLISQIKWQMMMPGQMVVPSGVFKVGYSENPFKRLAQLKHQSSRNLALFGVVICRDEEEARQVEAICHDALSAYRRRGEWFKCDHEVAWDTISGKFPASSLWLTRGYNVDLETMQIVPFPPGSWGGMSDNYHHYRDYKENGVMSGPCAELQKAAEPCG